jgi:opacity protein-like surface antigen
MNSHNVVAWATVGVAAAVLTALAAPVSAQQSRGVVVAERAIIWRSDVSVPITVVASGTELEVTGRSERWYEVVVPANLGGRGERGLIAIAQLKLVEGTGQPPTRTLRGAPPPQTPRPPAPAPARRDPRPAVTPRAFGQLGLMTFSARQSFEAILGKTYGATFGGGGQLRFRSGAYLQGSIERFREVGQRVFVLEDTTYPLGVPDTITIVPITASAGYVFQVRSRVVPYAGGGIGSYFLKEETPFDEPGEDVDERHFSYQVHGGVELRIHPWLVPAVEVQYTTVPDALATNGVSAAFNERDLGGWQLQLKILVGK